MVQPLPIPRPTNPQANPSPPAYRFNCAQRAHANYSENHPSMVIALLIAGVRFPRIAAGLGAAWTISRYLFMTGYSNLSLGRAGKGRYRGVAFWLAQFGLIGLAGWSGLEMVMGW